MDSIERQIIERIDAAKDEIIAFGRYIWDHAELGFKEHETSAYFTDFCDKMGLAYEKNLALTGVKAKLKEAQANEPTVALVAEMDALPFSNHPGCNVKTGAAHNCGHNAQMAGMMGAMLAFADPDVKAALGGGLQFIAVPSEEFVDMEFKNGLISEGKLKYGGGKAEMIRLGCFDDVDMAVGHHSMPDDDLVLTNHPYNGFINKMVRFTGLAAHAAEAPDKGIDALNAATLAMHALDQQRESFLDNDHVRVHGFISKGGEAMNVIADTVTMEYSVRAKSVSSYLAAADRFDRCMKAGAMANGAAVEIRTIAGYFPVEPVPRVNALEAAMESVRGNYRLRRTGMENRTYASSDFGDLSHLMPVMQFFTGGFKGRLHTVNCFPDDEYLAYVMTAKIFALTAYHLLKDHAAEARALKAEFSPIYSKAEYMKVMDSMSRTDFFDYRKSEN